MRKARLWERIVYRRGDAMLLGFDQRPGWLGELPFYRWRCNLHGYVEGYPTGYDRRLECAQCLAESANILRDKQ